MERTLLGRQKVSEEAPDAAFITIRGFCGDREERGFRLLCLAVVGVGESRQ